jgi:hypothetical protein
MQKPFAVIDQQIFYVFCVFATRAARIFAASSSARTTPGGILYPTSAARTMSDLVSLAAIRRFSLICAGCFVA